MIVKLFNHGHVLYQTPDHDGDIANEAIAAQLDNNATICLEQLDQSIVINRASVPDLCKLLKKLADLEVK